MGLFDNLRKRLQPATIEDPVFGRLAYIHIKQNPAMSYWEAEYVFPPTGTVISAGLQGGNDGPRPEAREFYLSMEKRFEEIMKAVLPALDQVFLQWVGRRLNADPWADIECAGFDVGDLDEIPRNWSIMFEATGDRWLGITVPFVGDEMQAAIVDT